MRPTVESIEVRRPAADAYAYVTDPTRFHEWQHGVVSGRMEHDDPRGPRRCTTVRRIGISEQRTTSELVCTTSPHGHGASEESTVPSARRSTSP